MNAQVKRKPTKTRNNAVMNPVAEAVQFVELQKAQVVIMKMDKAIEDLTSQRNEFDLAACIMSDMLNKSDAECDFLRAQLECAKADLRAAQAEIKRLEHSADCWRDAWIKADRKVCKLGNVVALLAGLLAGLLCVWGAV